LATAPLEDPPEAEPEEEVGGAELEPELEPAGVEVEPPGVETGVEPPALVVGVVTGVVL